MFYLTLYFGLLKRASVLFLLHFGLLVLIALSVIKAISIQKFVYSTLASRKDNPHFYAIMSKAINHSRISRKIAELPGIKKVVLIDSGRLSQETHKILSSVELVELGTGNLDLVGLNVIFQRGLKQQSMKLVQSYLKRLVKTETLVIGDIKNVDNRETSSLFITYASVFLTAVLCFFWLIINHLMAKKIQQKAYIVEQFQRKKFVALKAYAFSTIFLIIIPSIVAVIFIKIPFFSLALALLALGLGAVNYKTVKWQG